MSHYAGVDLGATNLRAQVVDAEATPRGENRCPTPRAAGAEIEAAVVTALEAACTDAGIAPDALAAVGIGSMGPLDRAAGVVSPANVPAERVELVAAVESIVDCPVVLHNDAVAGAIAERHFAGAPENTVYLTVSSGIGAGAVVDGHVLEGARGNAAEVGHFVVEPGGRPCGCGGRGHWEAYCSGTAIPDLVRDHAGEVTTALDLATLDAADVFAAAGEDPLADRVLELVATYNTLGVADLVHAFAPDLVSVGGAVARHNEGLVLDPIRERLPAHLAVPTPELRLTPLGDEAVLRGAVAAVLTHDDPTPDHNG
jgi:glucokinase